MSNKKEVIVCAAVRFYRDYDDEKGIIIMGLNHEQCGDIYNSLSHDGYCECNEGYITNLNNFVTRYEALEISGLKNQLRFKDRDYLLPDDLY